MFFGPYQTKGKRLSYLGNKIFKPITEIRNLKPPDFSKRHLELKQDAQRWGAIMKIWDHIFRASGEFMNHNDVIFFDLPITTRMISSPGALTGTISSDVDPFRIKFFNNTTFLTQSSQLYLEFAITNPQIDKVFCWEKSFRREKADFRHLPEFTHLEFEGNIHFEENLEFQRKYIQYIINHLIQNLPKELALFLEKNDIQDLREFAQLKKFKKLKFHDAFQILRRHTGDPKYDNVTFKNFGAYEEVLLTEIIGAPLFVTHFIENEVAFYHAKASKNSDLTKSADFLFPGYGEIIGSGERVHTRKETKAKVKHFKLDFKDYQYYIESRARYNPKIHSGWGVGIERLIQVVLKLPFIWDTKLFPRVDGQNRP